MEFCFYINTYITLKDSYYILLLLLSLLFLIIIIVELHSKPVEPRDRGQSGFMGRDATCVN